MKIKTELNNRTVSTRMAIGNAIIGAILCITIIGIPWGKQFFKIAKLSLMPFGAQVVRDHVF